MKNKLLEIITRHLAPPARLVALAMALFAVGGAWAATLSYSGYISADSANPTAVFTDVSLSDIGYKYVLSGNLGGGYVATQGPAGVYNSSLSSGTLTVQFQREDDGYCKVAEVKLTESSGTICAYVSRAGYETGGSLGTTNISWWGTPVDTADGNGYGVYDIALILPPAGSQLTITNVGQSSTQSAGNLAVTETYTLTYPTASLASGYVRLNSFAFGMNSSGDAFNTKYVTCNDYRGTNVVSAIANGTGSIQTSTKFGNNSLKESYAFGGAGAANECIIKVGTGYAFGMQDGNGTNVLQRVYMINTTNGDYSPVKQSASATSYRATQEVVATVVASAETSTGGNWSEIFTNPPSDWTAATSAPVLVIVTDDCSIALDTTVSAESVIFDVAEGKTLTLTGSNTITAASGIFVRGGTVVVPAANTLSGTVYGDGTIVYTAKPTTLTLTDSAWAGVLWLKNVAVDAADPSTLAGENSVLRLTGCTGYFNPSTKMTCECLGTLDLQDDGSTKAFTVNNGWSGSGITIFAKLTGSGSIVSTTRDISQRYVFKDPSGFEGTINCVRTDAAANKYLRVILGDGSSLSPDNGTITIVAETTVSVAANTTWSADKIIVNGSLTVGSGATIPAVASGSTGSVTVTSGTATISGIKDSEFAAAIVIYPNATLAIADTTVSELTIPAEFVDFSDFTYYNQGTLDLTGCTSLTSLYLDMGASTSFNLSNVLLPASCTTVAVDAGEGRSLSGYSVTKAASGQDGVTVVYVVEETKAEYGTGSLEVTNVPEGVTVYVKRADGTTVAATVTDGTARLSDFGEIKIDGAATGFDATFTNTLAMAYSEISDAFINTSTAEANRRWENEEGFYIYQAPWLSGGGQYFYDHSAEIGIVVVGKMTPSYNKIFIHIGNSNSGGHGILIATGAAENEVVIAYNDANTVTPITTMTVPNAATSRHVYVINKVDSGDQSIVTIYLDGIKWKTVSLSKFEFTAASGVQVGSDFGGAIWRSSGGTYSGGNVTDTSDTGVLNVMRVFGHALGTAQVNAFTEEYPYVSPNGSSVRTFDTANEAWIEDGTADWANTYEETTTQAEAPRAGSALTVNTSVATTISANLESTVSYDSLTVNGTGATFAKVNGYGGVISVAGSSVIGAPVTINAGALVLGGPVTITEGGSVTFNYSDYEVASADVIQLTGEMEEAESGKITIIPPTDGHYTYTYGYSGTQYVITPAVAVAVLNHNDTLTGYTSIADAVEAAEAGDTITLQTTDLTPSTLIYTAEGEDKSGVTFVVHGVEVAAVYDGSADTTWTTDGYYHWTGEGTDTNWTTPANWGLSSSYPGSSDTVTFDSATEVTLTANQAVAGLILNANLTLSGSSTYGLTGLTSISGTGSLILNNSGIANASRSDLDFSNNVVIQGTGTNWMTGVGYYTGSKDYGSGTIRVRGTLTGSGYVEFRQSTCHTSGVTLYGNNSEFRGHVNVVVSEIRGTPRHAALFGALSAGSEYATWEVSGASPNAKSGNILPNEAGTINLGRLKGQMVLWRNSASPAINVKIGYAGTAETDDTITPLATANDGAWRKSNITITKVGAGKLTVAGPGDSWRTCILHYVAEEGVLNLTGYALKNYDNNGVQYADIAFSGGTVTYDDTIVAPATLDISSKIVAGTGAVSIEVPSGMEPSWATALTDSNAPHGLTKKGAGTLTLTAVPTYTGTTTVEAGTLVLPAGTTVADAVITGGTLQMVQGDTISKLAMTGGKIEVVIEGAVSDTTILTITELADGTTLTNDNFTYPASVTLNLDTETTPGSVLVKATRPVKNYVWTGTVDNTFETLGNWLVNDEVPTEAPYPTIDTIEFPADGAPWTVALSEDAEVSSVAVNGAVTITGAKLLANAFTGSAAITLGGNAGIGDFEPTANMTIANPIVVSGTGNSLNALTRQVTYSGAISSADDTAALTLNGAVEMLILTGNNSGFLGTATMSGHVSLQSNYAGSENAKWVINNTTGDSDNPVKSGKTVYFGELSGTYTHVQAANNNYKNTLYIGALGTSFTLGGKFSDNNDGRAETIHKVGDGTMTFTGRYVDYFNLDAGTVYVTSTDGTVVHHGVVFNGGTLQLASGVAQDFSAKVVNSTAAIKVNVDSGAALTWATALNANNTVHEIVKTGAGTLTLSTAPLWDGTTTITVEEGSVVVPIDADITLAGDTYVSAEDETTKTLSKHSGYAADSDGTAGDETVAVPLSWVKSYVDGYSGMNDEAIVAALAADSETTQLNGYNYFTCYALGLNPATATDKPVVELVANGNGTFTAKLVHPDGTEIEAGDTVTLTTTFTRYNSPTAESGTELATPNAIDVTEAVDSTTGVGYIKASVTIGAKQ